MRQLVIGRVTWQVFTDKIMVMMIMGLYLPSGHSEGMFQIKVAA